MKITMQPTTHRK